MTVQLREVLRQELIADADLERLLLFLFEPLLERKQVPGVADGCLGVVMIGLS
jgi:hypothetical protein